MGIGEEMVRRLDTLLPINFTTHARLHGPLTAEALEIALRAAQARHPLLQVHIEDRGASAPWFRAGAPPLTGQIVEIGADTSDAALTEHLIRLTSTVLDTARGPLLRVVWLRHTPDRSTLLLGFHHAIGDGKSGVFLLRDIVTAANAVLRGESPWLPPLAPQGPLEARFPPPARLPGLSRPYLRAVARLAGGIVRRFPVTALADEAPADFSQRRLAVVWSTHEPDEIAALESAARWEKTTVHSALMAALVGAVRDELGVHDPAGVLCGTPVCMRDKVSPPLGEDVGFFVSTVAAVHAVHAGQDFWALARSIRAGVLEAVAEGQHEDLALGHFAAALPAVRRFGVGPVAWVMEATRLPVTAAITNIGRLTVDDRGPVRVHASGFAAGPSILAPGVVTASTVNGRMVLTFCGYEPVLSAARLTRLGEGMRARWRAAMDGRPRPG